jgi:hypothetical protein
LLVPVIGFRHRRLQGVERGQLFGMRRIVRTRCAA